MVEYYKLTDGNNRTYNNTKWGENITHKTNGNGELCGNGWIHVYNHPVLAIILNPIHANFTNPHLWEVKCGGLSKEDNGLKFGFTEVTTIKQINIPILTTTQIVKFGIICASKVYKEEKFLKWCDNWINNIDRSNLAASYAANAVSYAAIYAANAAAVAYAAAIGAASASAAANFAANAAAAAAADKKLDLVAIAEEALLGD